MIALQVAMLVIACVIVVMLRAQRRQHREWHQAHIARHDADDAAFEPLVTQVGEFAAHLEHHARVSGFVRTLISEVDQQVVRGPEVNG